MEENTNESRDPSVTFLPQNFLHFSNSAASTPANGAQLMAEKGFLHALLPGVTRKEPETGFSKPCVLCIF